MPRGGEHAQATSEKAAKADVGTFSMAAATHRVAVAAGAIACSLGPSLRGRAVITPPPWLDFWRAPLFLGLVPSPNLVCS